MLEQAAAIAEADAGAFVKSRGEILRNFIASMPAEGTAGAIRPTDTAAEQRGLEYLKARGLGASPGQLRLSARQGDAETVRAPVDAGADVEARNGSGMSPLSIALLMRKTDAAEALVARSARLSAREREIPDASVTDPRGKELVRRAAGK